MPPDPTSPRADSSFTIHRQGHHLVFGFPAPGNYCAGCGAYFFGFVFGGAGIVGFVQTLVLYVVALADGSPPRLGPMFGTLAGTTGLIAVGAGIVLLTLDGIRRSTTITLSKEGISFVCIGLFGARRYEWPLHEVAEVYVAPCGGPRGRVNRKLVVQTFDGRSRGFLRGRVHTEVEETAARLREELGMAAIKL
jgi:hypothetical protein